MLLTTKYIEHHDEEVVDHEEIGGDQEMKDLLTVSRMQMHEYEMTSHFPMPVAI